MAETQGEQQNNPNQQRVIDLNVNGHLMSLAPGLYCIYHAPGQIPADQFGFPGLRICLPPFKQNAKVEIEGFENDGWMGAEKSAVIVRVSGGAGLLLVTVYQNPSSQHPAPKLQVVRLNDAPDIVAQPTSSQVAPVVVPEAQRPVAPPPTAQVNDDIKLFAHVQGRGDVVVPLNQWIGAPESKKWIEGFGIDVKDILQPEDIEYQALLGKGWFSPWYKGNQFCGSRGMALPLCGLKIKLSDEAAKKYHIRLSATFVDGTKLGPIEDDTTLSAESIAPLEAIQFDLISIADGKSVSNTAGTTEVVQPKRVIKKIVPSKPVRSNVKLKTSAAKEAAAKAIERQATLKANNKTK